MFGLGFDEFQLKRIQISCMNINIKVKTRNTVSWNMERERERKRELIFIYTRMLCKKKIYVLAQWLLTGMKWVFFMFFFPLLLIYYYSPFSIVLILYNVTLSL